MNFFGWLLTFVPRETPVGDDTTEESRTNGAGIDPTVATPEGQKPDWCPEKFFDAEVGVRQEAMGKAYIELEGHMRTKTDELREQVLAEMRADVPENYELKIDESLEIPDDIQMNLTEDDPLVSLFFEHAKDWGLSQEKVGSFISAYIQREIEGLPKIDDELAKLGDYGKDRLQRVHNWMSQSLEADEMAHLAPFITNAESIQALEKLMKGTSAMNFDADDPSPALSLDELRSMQNDPRYWRDKDPAFIKKVEQGYQRLFNR